MIFKNEYQRPLIVAEIAQAHDGSLGAAEAYVRLAAELGADAVKFQTHIASEESSNFDQWRVPFSSQDASRFSYWERMEFTPEQWLHLKNICSGLNIDFVSSPFSVAAVDILERCDVPFYKIASGEVDNRPMLEAIKLTGKPVIISTGLSDQDALTNLVEFFSGQEIAILHCVSEYPTPANHVKIDNIERLRREFPRCAIGLSDHSGEIYPSLVAMHMGIEVLELHLTFDKRMFGPDTSSSLTPEQFSTIIKGASFISEMKHQHENDEEKKHMRKLFGRSAFYADNYEIGTIFTSDMIKLKKPGGVGLSYGEVEKLIGSRLATSVSKDELVKKNHAKF